MISVEMRVGRFVEIRGSGKVTVEEMSIFRNQLFSLMVRAGRPIVACVDMRGLEPFDDMVASMFVGLMRGDNPHVERSAHLSEIGSAYHEQAREMIQQARNPSRQLFDLLAPLTRWLGEVLTAPEEMRLRAFLAERPKA